MYKSLNEFEMARCDHWFPWQQIGLQWKKRCHHIFSNVFDRIHFILAGNDDIHKSLNEFKIRRGPTTGFHGNRYCYNLKNGVAPFSRLFLMGSFSY